MVLDPSIERAWIASEFAKGIDAERSLAADARARADTPPDPSLGVLYHQIAEADERHASIVETIAARYGHTPSRSPGGGIGAMLLHLKERAGELGSTALERLDWDLTAKAHSVHWYTAWVSAFGAIGDAESARELAAVLAEEQAHRDALQEGLNRMVERGARGDVKPPN
jgi:hypothetical protein